MLRLVPEAAHRAAAMLSYRHGFHAGHHADVLKHAALVFVARYMQAKPGGILFVDTHAGAGVYDLRAPEAEKTAEYRYGIVPVLAHSDAPPALLDDYVALVRRSSPSRDLRFYPGSPALIEMLRRPQDRAVLFELHPTDRAQLADWAQGRKRVAVRHADGLAGLSALLPPPEKRALVLIDPSYEVKTEYSEVVEALAAAWRRFPGGVYIVWYPVVERARIDTMEAALRGSGIRKLLRIELCVAADVPGRGLTGSGLFVVNPPFTLPDAAQTALPWLADTLVADGPVSVDWLVPE